MLFRSNTNAEGKTVTARVIAFLKGPLTMKPGGFVSLGHVSRSEGKEVEITLTPTGDFDLQVERLEVERLLDPSEQLAGQRHLLGPGRALTRILEGGHLPSIVLWGPAGTGKTTLAHLLARAVGAELVQLSAVSSGVADARAVMGRAGGLQIGRAHV